MKNNLYTLLTNDIFVKISKETFKKIMKSREEIVAFQDIKEDFYFINKSENFFIEKI